jgi:hypothetical protein
MMILLIKKSGAKVAELIHREILSFFILTSDYANHTKT